MSYGELTLPPEWTGRNAQNGRFLKGHPSHNKGKTWDEFMSKRGQQRSRKGWKNLDLHRNKNGRSPNAGRAPKAVIAVADDGRWCVFDNTYAAARWAGGIRSCVSRCCRMNQSHTPLRDPHGRPTTNVNTDHRYKGYRFYFESDRQWRTKVSS